jgi:hypothetical protein
MNGDDEKIKPKNDKNRDSVMRGAKKTDLITNSRLR